MGWTVPRTWLAGELVRVRYFRTDVADNFAYLKRSRDRAAFVPGTTFYPINDASVTRIGTEPNSYAGMNVRINGRAGLQFAFPVNLDSNFEPTLWLWWTHSQSLPEGIPSIAWDWYYLAVADGESLVGTKTLQHSASRPRVGAEAAATHDLYVQKGFFAATPELGRWSIPGIQPNDLLLLVLYYNLLLSQIGANFFIILGASINWRQAI